MTQMMKYEGLDGTQKNKVYVAVRFRPLRCAAPRIGGKRLLLSALRRLLSAVRAAV